ncbi:MAG: HD domain-containing protein [Rickettsiales bacterium]|nr:HD domain-containing protein [Rickettsiales bacterium]
MAECNTMVKINHPLYGDFNITEQVLIDLMASPSLGRLGKIQMGGYYPGAQKDFPFNRLEHSIGVFLLLRRLGARLEEQAAGLIHDVSHPALSHTIDYIDSTLDNQKAQPGHDPFHRDFVLKSELPEIFEHHKMDTEYILNPANFPLLENNLPDICADRIDYSLVGGMRLRQEDGAPSYFSAIIDALVIRDNEIIFNSVEPARRFVENFQVMNEIAYANFEDAVMFGLNGEMLSYAISKGYVKREDLWKYGDDAIITDLKCAARTDGVIRKYLHALNRPPEANMQMGCPWAPINVYIKNRVVDPKFADGNEIKRVSNVSVQHMMAMRNTPKFMQYRVCRPAQRAR